MSDESITWLEVRRFRQHARCQEFALVLAALDIDHWVRREDDGYGLLATAEEAQRAGQELAEYEVENREWPPREVAAPVLPGRIRDAWGYWLVLLAFYVLDKDRAYWLDWSEAGRSHAHSILQGEWWRAVTALTLHADGVHLLSNLIFGSLFGVLLCADLGTGLAWLAILTAGAAGNGANAWLQPSDHTSIGASTGVFGGVGLLVALQWRFHGGLQRGRLRRWAPLIVGAVIPGYLGTGGKRTDVLAHVTGMVAGGVLGLLLSVVPYRPPVSGWLQGVLGVVVVAVLALSWALALGWAP